MKKCRVNNSTRSVNINGTNMVVTDKLELVITNKNTDIPETRFEFYNTEYDSLSISDELQLTEKWCKVINQKITLLSSEN